MSLNVHSVTDATRKAVDKLVPDKYKGILYRYTCEERYYIARIVTDKLYGAGFKASIRAAIERAVREGRGYPTTLQLAVFEREYHQGFIQVAIEAESAASMGPILSDYFGRRRIA